MSRPTAASLLSQLEQQRWLIEHIPHRIRAVLAGLPIRSPWFVPMARIMPANAVAQECIWAAIHEGRYAAMRWLIMFIGIQEKGGNAVVTPLTYPETDVRIDSISGGVLFTTSRPEALKLALIWKGCSQASSHATQGTNHPDIRDTALAEALTIVISHLEKTIYAANAVSLFDAVHHG